MTDVVPVSVSAPPASTAPVDTTSAPAELARMFKVTVDGSEREVSEDDLRRGYAHGTAANERMRQANETRQMAEEVLSIFKTNPKMAFEKLGVDSKAFAEGILNDYIEESMLSPQDKELRDARKFMKEKADGEAKTKAEQTSAQEAAYREQIGLQLQQDIIGTLEQSGLPKNEYTVGRMAYYMEAAISAGFNNVSSKDIISHVRDEYQRDVKALLSSVPESSLLDFLGDDFTKKTVKAHMAKVGGPKSKIVTQAPPLREGSAGTKKIVSPSEFFKRRK